jgi:hypothetical protein
MAITIPENDTVRRAFMSHSSAVHGRALLIRGWPALEDRKGDAAGAAGRAAPSADVRVG